MSPDTEASRSDLVRVRDAWNGWRTAEVARSELHDVQWLRPAGAPQPLLHARVRANGLFASDARGPHAAGEVDVYVLKVDVLASIYECLAREASIGLQTR